MAKNDKNKETSQEVSNNDDTSKLEVSTPVSMQISPSGTPAISVSTETTPVANVDIVKVSSPISHNITNWLKKLIHTADNDLKGTLHALDLAFAELKVIGARLEHHASDDIKKLVQYIKSL